MPSVAELPGVRHRLARDGAAGTRPVIEDDLSKICRDMLGNETGNVVGRPAGREWHDQADRPVRIRLCRMRLGGGGTARSQDERDGGRDQQVRSGHDGASRIRREGIASTGAKLELSCGHKLHILPPNRSFGDRLGVLGPVL